LQKSTCTNFCFPHAAGFERQTTKLAKPGATLALPSWQVTQDTALFAELLSVPTGEGKPFITLSQRRRKEFLLERVVGRSAASSASNHAPEGCSG
jgi:hypothetical protein